MSTKPSTRPATAAAVTRTLTAAGIAKSQEHKSGMVRGYSTFTAGITSENVVEHHRNRVRRGSHRDGSPRYAWEQNNQPTGFVTVSYVHGRVDDRLGRDAANAKATAVLDKAAEVLRAKGYTVTSTTRGGASAAPALTVSRLDAAGAVIVY